MLDQGTLQTLANEGIKFEHSIENSSLFKLGAMAIGVFLIISIIKKLS